MVEVMTVDQYWRYVDLLIRLYEDDVDDDGNGGWWVVKQWSTDGSIDRWDRRPIEQAIRYACANETSSGVMCYN